MKAFIIYLHSNCIYDIWNESGGSDIDEIEI